MSTKAFSASIIIFPEYFYDASKSLFQSFSFGVAKEKRNQFCGGVFSTVLGKKDDISAVLDNQSL